MSLAEQQQKYRKGRDRLRWRSRQDKGNCATEQGQAFQGQLHLEEGGSKFTFKMAVLVPKKGIWPFCGFPSFQTPFKHYVCPQEPVTSLQWTSRIAHFLPGCFSFSWKLLMSVSHPKRLTRMHYSTRNCLRSWRPSSLSWLYYPWRHTKGWKIDFVFV